MHGVRKSTSSAGEHAGNSPYPRSIRWEKSNPSDCSKLQTCRSYGTSRSKGEHTPTIRSMLNISSNGVCETGCVERRMVGSWLYRLLSVWFDMLVNIFIGIITGSITRLLKCLSCLQGNRHGQFLEGLGLVTAPGYSARRMRI